MIGRATFGRPWIFKEIRDYLDNTGAAPVSYTHLILAATALAAHRRNDILHRIDENRIARQLLYPADEISL